MMMSCISAGGRVSSSGIAKAFCVTIVLVLPTSLGRVVSVAIQVHIESLGGL